MNFFQETLHIFFKDARRLRIGIYGWIILIAVTAISFRKTAEYGMFPVDLATTLTVLAIVFAWVLVSLAVLQDPLVSDKQFWITRPYRRAALLASKLLFVIVVLIIPVTIMQLCNLAQFHVPILPELPLLALNAIGLGVLAVPFIASAAIAPRFVSAIFYVFGLVLYVALGSSIYAFTNYGFDPNFTGWLPWVMLLSACIAAILIQYFSRRTAFARGLIVSSIVIVSVCKIVPMPNIGVHIAYPALKGTNPPVTISIADGDTDKSLVHEPSRDDDTVRISIPMEFSTASNDTTRFFVDGTRTRLRSANGEVVDGGWVLPPSRDLGTSKKMYAVITVPRGFFDRAAGRPVSLLFDAAVSHGLADPRATYRLTESPTPVKGLGRCSLKRNDVMDYRMECVRAFLPPRASDIVAGLHRGFCEDAHAGDEDSAPGYIGFSQTDLVPISLTGLYFESAYFTAPTDEKDAQKAKVTLCPGARISVTQWTSLPSFTVSLEAAVNLNEHIADNRAYFERN